MKILIVTPYFYPSIGGIQNYVLTLSRALNKDYGYEIVIVTTSENNKKIVKEKFENIDIYRLPIWFKISNTPINPFWFFHLRRIIKLESPDIINGHSPVPFISDIAFIAKGRIPFVLTYHSGSMKKGSNIVIDSMIELYEKLILKKILNHSDKIISVYPSFLYSLLERKNKEILFIPPAVDTRTFKPASKEKTNNKTVLFVGRIEKSSRWKGIATLIKAMPEVVKKIPDVSLLFVGDGDAVEDYANLAASIGLAKQVRFLGKKYGKSLVKVYQNASVLVLPSETDSEAFGIVLIEAMSCGIPVIGSNIGGIPSVISNEKNGLLIPIRNSSVLAQAIVKILSNSKLSSSLGKAGRKVVIKDFSIQNLSLKTDQTFKNILKST